MSKFMFHIKFSRQEDYLHEHELYEMLRSRNLYQVQFDLKKRLQKRIRSIELAEKVNDSTYRSRKAVFLQKVQDQMKLKAKTENKQDGEDILPDIDVDGKSRSVANVRKYLDTQKLPQSIEKEPRRSNTAPEQAPDLKEQMSGSKRGKPDRIKTSSEISEDLSSDFITSKRSLTFCGNTFPVTKSAKRRATQRKHKLSAVDEDEEIEVAITEFHKSRNDKMLGTDDRITKLPDINKSDKILQRSVSFTGSLDGGDQGYPLVKTLSTPDLAILKSMSIYESGVTAPDGSLILSKEDYKQYMEKYRKLEKVKLHKQKKSNKSLEKRIQSFIEEPSEFDEPNQF